MVLVDGGWENVLGVHARIDGLPRGDLTKLVLDFVLDDHDASPRFHDLLDDPYATASMRRAWELLVSLFLEWYHHASRDAVFYSQLLDCDDIGWEWLNVIRIRPEFNSVCYGDFWDLSSHASCNMQELLNYVSY